MYVIAILIDKCKLSHGDIHTQNIIIEVVQEGKFRIRLIDYGEACEYTKTNLRNDMKNLVYTISDVLIGNDKKKPEIWGKNPNICKLCKRTLDVNDIESLTTFRNHVEDLLVENRKDTDFNNRLEEIANELEE